MFGLKLIYQVHVLVVLLIAAHAVSVPDPIAFYPLNSKYETREINNRQPQGIPVGVSLAAGPKGKAGGSYQFAGQANSYIELPNSGGLDVQHSITMLCWIYPQNRHGPIFMYRNETSDDYGVKMWMFYGGIAAGFPPRTSSNPPNKSVYPSTTLALNQWHYVGSSYDNNTGIAAVWLNGKLVGQKNIGAGMNLHTQDNVKMGVTARDKRYLQARITAMQVYNVALSKEQINAVKNAGQDIDECSLNSVVCYNGGSASCVDGANEYMCECQAGYIGQHCEWEKQGCWKEAKYKIKKAMANAYDKFKQNKDDVQATVEACLKSAEEKQLQIFGVRREYRCVTTKDSANFRVYGRSEGCKEQGDYGVGVEYENYVYILKKEQ